MYNTKRTFCIWKRKICVCTKASFLCTVPGFGSVHTTRTNCVYIHTNRTFCVQNGLIVYKKNKPELPVIIIHRSRSRKWCYLYMCKLNMTFESKKKLPKILRSALPSNLRSISNVVHQNWIQFSRICHHKTSCTTYLSDLSPIAVSWRWKRRKCLDKFLCRRQIEDIYYAWALLYFWWMVALSFHFNTSTASTGPEIRQINVQFQQFHCHIVVFRTQNAKISALWRGKGKLIDRYYYSWI